MIHSRYFFVADQTILKFVRVTFFENQTFISKLCDLMFQVAANNFVDCAFRDVVLQIETKNGMKAFNIMTKEELPSTTFEEPLKVPDCQSQVWYATTTWTGYLIFLPCYFQQSMRCINLVPPYYKVEGRGGSICDKHICSMRNRLTRKRFLALTETERFGGSRYCVKKIWKKIPFAHDAISFLAKEFFVQRQGKIEYYRWKVTWAVKPQMKKAKNVQKNSQNKVAKLAKKLGGICLKRL